MFSWQPERFNWFVQVFDSCWVTSKHREDAFCIFLAHNIHRFLAILQCYASSFAASQKSSHCPLVIYLEGFGEGNYDTP